MKNRWITLAVLFTARTVIGIQFQSVASVSPFLINDLDIDYTRLGVLIGLYHLPGVVLAFPGGLLGKRLGDKRTVMCGFVLMAIGGLIMGVNDSYAFCVTGRFLSGVGSILLNVILTKMIADWFVGKEIITAMAILASSWPFGISLGLISLSRLATVSSWQFVMYVTTGASLVALVLVAAFYRTPPAGIIMALPAEVLHPENRAAGMGLFYSCFYGGMMALTSLAGFSRDLTQNAATPILFGGMLLIIAIIILAIFRMFQARIKLIPAE